MNKSILKQLGFRKEVQRVEQKKCPLCGKPINMEDFRNEISKREYSISGMCQECQDDVFGKD